MAHVNPIPKMIETGFLKAHEAGNPLAVLIRMCSIPIVVSCVRLGVHPNIVTSFSLALGCAASFFYFNGSKDIFFAAWTASVVLDYSDGTIARKSGKESYFGYLYDMLGDRVKLITLLAAWAFYCNIFAAYCFSLSALVILLLIELISHLFVQKFQRKDVGARKGINASVFFSFDMHSFLIYGTCLYFGGSIGLVGTLWLNILLIKHLIDQLCLRFAIRSGQLEYETNSVIIGKWKTYKG